MKRGAYRAKVCECVPPETFWKDNCRQYALRLLWKRGQPTAALSLKSMAGRILEELAEKYPDVNYDSEDLFFSMDKFYRKNQMPFVIIIDEWDAVFRERRGDKAVFIPNKEILDEFKTSTKSEEWVPAGIEI